MPAPEPCSIAMQPAPPVVTAAGPFRVEKDTLTILEGFPFTAYQFYRISYESRSASNGYFVADFYNPAGERNYADKYTGIDAAADWTPNTSVFMARAETVTGNLGIRPNPAPLEMRNIAITPITKAEALAWMEGMAAAEPVLPPAYPADRWEFLPQTRARLLAGKPLHVVALGCSVSNDVQSSMWNLWVERRHPGTTIRLTHANSVAKHCKNYQAPEILEQLVFRHRPDLLTIGGVSHRTEQEAIVNIVKQTRAILPACEILYFDASMHPFQELELQKQFIDSMIPLARANRFALIDLSTPYLAHLKKSGRPVEYYQRDAAHGNDRGKQIVGRLYAPFFDAK